MNPETKKTGKKPVMVALTFVRFYSEPDEVQRLYRWTAEDWTAALFYPLRDAKFVHDGKSLSDYGWLGGEIQMIANADTEQPQVVFDRLINLRTPLREYPLAPALAGATPGQARDLVALLRRGAAAVETPDDLNEDEKTHVAEDLCLAADQIERGRDLEILSLVKHLRVPGPETGHPLAGVLRRAIRAIRRPEEPTQTADGRHDAGRAELLEQLEDAAQVYETPASATQAFIDGTLCAGPQTGRFSAKEPNLANSPKRDPLPPLRAAAQVLAAIADRYDENGLDGEARRFWGKNDERENDRAGHRIILYTGRGGGTLLTLQDCFNAREALRAMEASDAPR